MPYLDWNDSGLLIVKIWMQVARGMEYLASMKVSSEVPPVTEVPLVPDEVTGERHVFKISRDWKIDIETCQDIDIGKIE